VQQADGIKLHKASGKVTFLAYDDFDGRPLPALQTRTKVNLRTRWVQVFGHRAEGQLLYFKERLVAPDHPQRRAMEKFSAKVRKLGIANEAGTGPTTRELARLIEHRGLNARRNRRRIRAEARSDETAGRQPPLPRGAQPVQHRVLQRRA